MTKKITKKNDFDFNQGLTALEEIVEKMQNETLTLEQSLSYFEEGIALSKRCQKALEQAKQRILKLTADDDYQQAKDFDIKR